MVLNNDFMSFLILYVMPKISLSEDWLGNSIVQLAWKLFCIPSLISSSPSWLGYYIVNFETQKVPKLKGLSGKKVGIFLIY